MKRKKTNPKALNLEILKNSDFNVTLGFKIEPEIKLQLAEEAKINGLSLSAYVKKIVISKRDMVNKILKEKNHEIEYLKKKNRRITSGIEFYENETLRKIFVENRNKTVSYENNTGEIVKKEILNIGDVYTILINSFKNKK